MPRSETMGAGEHQGPVKPSLPRRLFVTCLLRNGGLCDDLRREEWSAQSIRMRGGVRANVEGVDV